MSLIPLAQNIQIPSNATLPAASPAPQPEPEEHGDSVTLGNVAKNAAKFIGGTALTAVRAPFVALTSGLGASTDAAIKGLNLDEKRCLSNDILKIALTGAPLIALAGVALGGGGLFAAVAASFMAPGGIGGAISAVKGGITGGMQGLDKTINAGHIVQDKVEEKLGEFAGKAAKIATNVAMGAIAIPACAVMGAFRKSMDFGLKASGVKEKPADAADARKGVINAVAVSLGAMNGMTGASTGPGAVLGFGVGAGSVGTGIAGFRAAIDGIVETAKESFSVADKAIDKLTKK